MSEIQLKINELNTAIDNMQKIKSECSGIDMKEPDVQGGGNTVNEIGNMVDVYKNIKTQLDLLFTNTISFLSTTKNAFEAADKNAAKQIVK